MGMGQAKRRRTSVRETGKLDTQPVCAKLTTVDRVNVKRWQASVLPLFFAFFCIRTTTTVICTCLVTSMG